MTTFRLLLAGLFLPAFSLAAEMRAVHVEYEDGYYYLESEVWFDVGREAIFDVFLDWDLAEEYSSIIVEAKNVGPDESGGMGYYIHNRGCILFFCKSALRSGSVTSEAYEYIHAIADPETSDFEVSDETWTFRNADDGTIVRYELKMKPDFWIPPVVGPYLMKRKLRNEGGDAIDRIEQIAQRLEAQRD